MPLGRTPKAGRGAILEVHTSHVNPGRLEDALTESAEVCAFVEDHGAVNARCIQLTDAGMASGADRPDLGAREHGGASSRRRRMVHRRWRRTADAQHRAKPPRRPGSPARSTPRSRCRTLALSAPRRRAECPLAAGCIQSASGATYCSPGPAGDQPGGRTVSRGRLRSPWVPLAQWNTGPPGSPSKMPKPRLLRTEGWFITGLSDLGPADGVDSWGTRQASRCS